MKVFGLDVSLNHGAIIELTAGELSDFWYFTDTRGAADQGKKHATFMKPFREKDPILRGLRRLEWIELWIHGVVMKAKPAYGGFEDYAYSQVQGAHQLGEAVGVAKMLFWRKRIPFRVHDISSIKMFAAHDGTASKDDVVEAVTKRWGHDFTAYNPPIKTKPGKERKSPPKTMIGEDLSDAFTIAKMVHFEAMLRAGKMRLADLEHEKEIRVFNRTTQARPTNILDQDWYVRAA